MGGIGAQVAEGVHKRTWKDTRRIALGHLQRGGGPTKMDRVLCTAFSAEAVELIAEEKFGQMVSFRASQITSVSLSEATGELRRVPLDGGFVTAARAMGICLED